MDILSNNQPLNLAQRQILAEIIDSDNEEEIAQLRMDKQYATTKQEKEFEKD